MFQNARMIDIQIQPKLQTGSEQNNRHRSSQQDHNLSNNARLPLHVSYGLPCTCPSSKENNKFLNQDAELLFQKSLKSISR
jgi:hypothetical protein